MISVFKPKRAALFIWTLPLLLAISALPQTASADTLKLTLTNRSSFNARVVVKGGDLQGTPQIWGGQTKTFAVVVPDGRCFVDVRITSGVHGALDQSAFDLCHYKGFSFGTRRH